MGLDAITVIGFIGALVLLVGFLLNQLGHWETTDFEYDFINLIGAALLTVYSWQILSYPLIVLFAVWTLFSLKDVATDGLKNMKKKKAAQKVETPTMEETKEELKHEHDSMDAEQKPEEKEE